LPFHPAEETHVEKSEKGYNSLTKSLSFSCFLPHHLVDLFHRKPKVCGLEPRRAVALQQGVVVHAQVEVVPYCKEEQV
jgi:hypothetical protein